MAEFDLPIKMVSSLIFVLLPKKEKLTLVLDRTNWGFGTKNINILMLGVSYKNVAFPLMFKILDKPGNSNTQERLKKNQLWRNGGRAYSVTNHNKDSQH